MKNSLLLIFALVILVSCEKEDASDLLPEQHTYGEDDSRKPEKRAVCHNGFLKFFVLSAIPGHQLHGDAVDMDGDGYFDMANDCGKPVDCDDSDAGINPDVAEKCGDGIDNNCNGLIDEDCINTVELNGLTWTAENLDIEIPGSLCMNNNPANCETYGRLYTIQEAQAGCADLGAGWRLPTEAEWDAMVNSFGGLGPAPGSAYDELIVGGTSGFEGLFGGAEYNGTFQQFGSLGIFWSSTPGPSPGLYRMYFLDNGPQTLVKDAADDILRTSCRCVLD